MVVAGRTSQLLRIERVFFGRGLRVYATRTKFALGEWQHVQDVLNEADEQAKALVRREPAVV